MRLLIDTQVVLWQLGGLRPLSVDAYEAIGQASQLLLSVVSFAEIGVKASVGKLSVPPDFYNRVLDAGLQVLPLDAAHGLAVAELPLHHRDPFDRLLIAQAQRERLTLVSADPRLAAYDIPVIRAA